MTRGFGVLVVLFTVASFVYAYFLCVALRKASRVYKVLDSKESNPNRKFQSKPIPLLGGLSFIFTYLLFSFLLIGLSYFKVIDLNFFISIPNWADKLLWANVGILVLTLGGVIDDKYDIDSILQALFIFVAVSVTVFMGGFESFYFFDYLSSLLPVATDYIPSIMAGVWFMVCISCTKFLDGLDGIVASVGIVSLFSIAIISLIGGTYEPLIFLLSLVFISGLSAFLFSNFPNAKMYMGEAGSTVTGFMIGVLSILTSAKIATSVSVLGFFAIDLFLVWLLRLKDGRNPLTSGDTNHWHHRLLKRGFSKTQSLILTLLIILSSAHLALWLNRSLSIWVLVLQAVFILGLMLLPIKKEL